MTDPVVPEDDRRVRYVVSNPLGQSTFVADFPVDPILDNGMVVGYGISVSVNDVEIDAADYTFDPATSEVVLDTNAAQDDVVVLEGDTFAQRDLNYPLRGGLPSARLNGEANKFFYMIQELKRDFGRAVQLAKSLGGLPPKIAEAPAAGRAPIYDADGNLVNGPTADEITAAQGYAESAAEDAASAADSAAKLYGSSVSSVAIGTGAKTFTTQSGKFFSAGTWLIITSDAGPTNYMHGYVSSYSGTSLTVEVTNVGGSGTFADWTIRVSGTRGATGATGATGADGAAGDDAQRNLLINGQFHFNERAASSVADDAYCFDRWYALTQTANITVSQLSNAEAGQANSLRITQPNATAQRVGVAQIIESASCRHLRSDDAYFKARVRCSQSQALRYAILEWTGTADSVTSDVVNNWTSGTFTTGNFFNSTSLTLVATGSVTPSANAWTDLEGGAAVSGSMNNLIALVWTEGTLAQNETLDIGLAQLEQGDAASVFEYRPAGLEYVLCARFYQRNYYAVNEILGTAQSYTTAAAFGRLFNWAFPLRAKSGGTIAASAAGDFTGSNGSGAQTAFTTFSLGHAGSGINLVNSAVSGTPFTVGQANVVRSNNANAYIEISQEL